jgi:hypothetical protein
VSRQLIWGETAYVSTGLTELTKHRKALSFHAVSFGPHNDSLRQIVNIATQVQNSAPVNPAQPTVPCSYAEALDTVSRSPDFSSFFSEHFPRCNLLRHSSESQNLCASREALSFTHSPTDHTSPLYRKSSAPYLVNQIVHLFNVSLVPCHHRKAGIEYNVEIRHVECQIAEQIVRLVLRIRSRNVYEHCQHMHVYHKLKSSTLTRCIPDSYTGRNIEYESHCLAKFLPSYDYSLRPFPWGSCNLIAFVISRLLVNDARGLNAPGQNFHPRSPMRLFNSWVPSHECGPLDSIA